jgi:hypothetical protein
MNQPDRGGLTRRNVGHGDQDDEYSTPRKRMTNILKALDANPKLKEDYVSESTSGVITTLVCAALCLILFFGEFFSYKTTKIVSELRVNPLGVHQTLPNAERLKIDVDITFHSLACNLITLDTSDRAGEEHYDVHDGHIEKRRIDKHGKVIDAAFTSEKPNKHKEIKQALQKINETDSAHAADSHAMEQVQPFGGIFGLQSLLQEAFPEGVEHAFRNENQEGCEVKGYLEVNRVPGRFSISPGRSLMMGMQMVKLNVQTALNLTHTIHRLSFGESFPGLVSPLDGTHRSLPPNAVQQYFLNVVSTTFEPLGENKIISTHQYSVTETFTSSQRSIMGTSNGRDPGVIFAYEISPIRVDFKETRTSFGAFVLGICSIIGGVVTMAGIAQNAFEYIISNRKTLFAS